MQKQIRSILLSGAAMLIPTIAATTLSTAAYAQQVTSNIRGTVVDASGAAVSGASIAVTDTRVGSTRSITAAGNGSFSARNFEPGGPYLVRVSAPGYQTETITNVFLSLSETKNFNLQLTSGDASADTIIVTASRASQILSSVAIGPSSVFTTAQLEGLPSLKRDIRDVIRIDPRVIIDDSNESSISCLGGNNRFNSFTIDGVRSSDSFGLNASGLPSRNNMPIPFDAVRETSVEFAPFSVEYGQFTGCNINVITEAGTNEFHGSGFFVFNNDNLTGSTINGRTVQSEPFSDKNWGASIGGPILKDRLFFFGSYEESSDANTQNTGPIGGGFANEAFLTVAEANQISDILSTQYGRDTLGFLSSLPVTNRRLLGRVDWQINDQHRAAFTFYDIDDLELEPDDFGFNGLAFGDNFEASGTDAQSYSARLFSNWTNNFSTEIRLSRLDTVDEQNPFGGGEAQDANPIPRIVIQDGAGDDIAVSGPGFFRSANSLTTTLDQVRIKGDYTKGNHTFTAGYELDHLEVFNLFVPNATGTIIFDDIAALAAGQANFIFGNGAGSGNINDAAAVWSRNIHTLYLQDQWQATDALTLTAGLRYDFYGQNDAPPANANFAARYGFSNSTNLDGLDVIQPRLGFSYEGSDWSLGQTSWRGGLGIFSGADPSVFFSNAFTNFGSGVGGANIFNAPCTGADLQVTDANGQFTGLPGCLAAAISTQAGLNADGRVDAIDPNFELPSVLRASLGFSHYMDLGTGGFFDDWSIDADFIYSDRRNSIDFVDLTLTPTGVITPDGRPLFNAVDPLLAGCNAVFLGIREGFSGDVTQGSACDAGGDDQDILLTNATEDGRAITFSLQANKSFDVGSGNFDFRVGYAFTDATETNPVTSSTATSGFEEVALSIINLPPLAQASRVNTHNFTVTAMLEQEFIKDLPTRFSAFFNARSGGRFSTVFDNNTATSLFGDSDNEERHLIYIPTGPNDPLVQFAPGFDTTGFFAFLAETGLDQFGGQIAPRNITKNPWFIDLDLRIQQDLPALKGGHRFSVFLDLENALNFVSDGANIFRRHDSGDVAEGLPVVDAALSADGSQFVYSNFRPGGGGNFRNSFAGPSLWAVQVGIRYSF
ncbi:MAG: TonB-dependent receptor [Robiginitomaculum sp.]|nr:TonB-dependent receptor [Robiginitomaculum sp.]